MEGPKKSLWKWKKICNYSFKICDWWLQNRKNSDKMEYLIFWKRGG